MINLELASKHQQTYEQTMMLAEHMIRPVSRKYDKEEHAYPKEMEEVAKLIGGANDHFSKVETQARRAHTAHVDEATTLVKYPNGRAEVTASRCAAERERRMILTYATGTIAINFLTREIENTTEYTIKADVSADLPDPLGAADEAFFAAALGERDCAIPGREAAHAVHLAEQAELSALHTLGT